MNTTMYIDALFAQQACLWEVSARKPGNVHRYHDFEDTTYLDFALSAAAIAPCLAMARDLGLGETIYNCVSMARMVTPRNTNLGIILLLTPLAKSAGRDDLESILAASTVNDAEWTYAAIRLAQPGGLGDATAQDVHGSPTVTLREAMALAADRDMIARQYANGFREVFDVGAPAVLEGIERTGCVEGGIIFAHLFLMSRYPDSLIARKCGSGVAADSAARAGRVLDLGWPHAEAGRRDLAELDNWLRAEGHRRNPGTTADLIAASLYVLLREARLSPRSDVPWPLAAGAP